MSLHRVLPISLRLPLIHGTLDGLTQFYGSGWGSVIAPENIKPGPLIFSGFLNAPSGVGRAARASLDALQAAGFAPYLQDMAHIFPKILTRSATLPVVQDHGVWFIHANAPECQAALLAHPSALWRRRYRIAFWAWETPVAPKSWARTAAHFHQIWVPSRFVYDALATAMDDIGRPDLKTRLVAMPHPQEVLSHVTTDRAKARKRFDLDPNAYEILSLFSTHSATVRKNPFAVIEAWKLAFAQAGNGARLRLKVQNLDSEKNLRETLTSLIHDRPDISLIEGDFDDAAMRDFVSAFDGLISLHRAEGFGLSLSEAMGLGVSVIATNWSGNTDFMNSETAFMVPYELAPINDSQGPYGRFNDPRQVWAEPDIHAAGRALRELVLNTESRFNRIRAAREAIRALNLPWQAESLSQMPLARYLPAVGEALETMTASL